MRDGFKIYDSDTHLSPMAKTLELYFDAAMRKRLPEWESCKVPFRVGWADEIFQPPYRHRYPPVKKRAGVPRPVGQPVHRPDCIAPWGAMRAVSAFFGAGIMDRYPNIRYCILESGFGWLRSEQRAWTINPSTCLTPCRKISLVNPANT
jgi:hypothetical protein